MGKNHGKRKPKTALARWTSAMAKLDNELAKQRAEQKQSKASQDDKDD